jgi:hypothetical protein
MPAGKPAGVRCLHLTDDLRCRIFGSAERPSFCSSLQAAMDMCGSSREHAIAWLTELERSTTPARQLG